MLAQPDAISENAARNPRFTRPSVQRIIPPFLGFLTELSNKPAHIFSVPEGAIARAMIPKARQRVNKFLDRPEEHMYGGCSPPLISTTYATLCSSSDCLRRLRCVLQRQRGFQLDGARPGHCVIHGHSANSYRRRCGGNFAEYPGEPLAVSDTAESALRFRR